MLYGRPDALWPTRICTLLISTLSNKKRGLTMNVFDAFSHKQIKAALLLSDKDAIIKGI